MTKKEISIAFLTMITVVIAFYNSSLESNFTKNAFSYQSNLVSLYQEITWLQNAQSNQNLQFSTWTNCLTNANKAEDCKEIKILADIETANYQRAFERLTKRVEDYNKTIIEYYDSQKEKNKRQPWLNGAFCLSALLIIFILILPAKNMKKIFLI